MKVLLINGSPHKEGMQSMRAIGENMTWLLRSISEGKQDLPVQEPRKMTNFIR